MNALRQAEGSSAAAQRLCVRRTSDDDLPDLARARFWMDLGVIRRQLLSALGILVPVTLACAIPLAVYWYRRRAVWLAIALLLWVAAGYLFTVRYGSKKSSG